LCLAAAGRAGEFFSRSGLFVDRRLVRHGQIKLRIV
jgi:hypothetical protein